MLPSYNILLIQLAGLIVLAILSYQDIKTMTVDTRMNFLMFGLLAGFALQVNVAVLFFLIAGMIIVYVYFNLIRLSFNFGEADPEVLAWVFGTVTLDMLQGYVFFISFVALLIISALKYRKQRIPFVPLVALSYLVSFVYYVFNF